MIIERQPQYNNQLAQQIQQPQNIPIQQPQNISNQLLQNVKSGEPKIKSLIESIEPIKPKIEEVPKIINEPIKEVEPIVLKKKEPVNIPIQTNKRLDLKKIFENELFDRIKNPNLKSINQSDTFQTNELIKKINQPQNVNTSSFLEKALQ